MGEAENLSKSAVSGVSAGYYEFNNTHAPPKSPIHFQKPLTALNTFKAS